MKKAETKTKKPIPKRSEGIGFVVFMRFLEDAPSSLAQTKNKLKKGIDERR